MSSFVHLDTMRHVGPGPVYQLYSLRQVTYDFLIYVM